jgi:VanZ family protein
VQFWIRWTITLVWAAVIFLMSTGTYGGSFTAMLVWDILGFLHLSVTLETFHLIHHLVRKMGHLTEYGIFGIFLYHCFLNSNRTEWRPKAAFLAIMAAGLYSLTDEFHQIFVPGRGPALTDCGIDTMGATLAMLIVFMWSRLYTSRHPLTPKQENLPAVSA